ncbi:helix-turn-helix transcriptional regulator [uncultured Williamsia sp.]|uniref:helix-turn-helix transcriptional regulator n=1 Tax=uncultured Williamsia sp. TaxID=259311 RepID=UPI002619695C|nr:helix-turn-helix transcriptional regulator [uncultured Williamsia sp.]
MSRRVMRGFSPAALREAREAANISQADLARLAGVGRATLYHWEAGKATPQVDVLVKVVARLGISIADIVRVPVDERFPGDLRVLRGMTQPQLGKAAGVSTAMVGAIERGEVDPTDAVAQAIARELGVTTAELAAAHARAKARPPGTSA